MRSLGCALACILSIPLAHADPANSTAPGQQEPPASTPVETVVCIRHGEKAKGGLGSLNDQGLNRALALPDVLARYGKPAFIFAPDPGQDKINEGALLPDGKKREAVCYVRPLITIAPTAIRLGMPINTSFGFGHIANLEAELDKAQYQNALVFVAWEHCLAELFMKNLVRDHGGDPASVPVWKTTDFDSIYVACITRNPQGITSVAFQVDQEGLDRQSLTPPKPAAK